MSLRWPMVSWRVLKRLLLHFWAVWLSVVVVSNVCDGLKVAGVLPESFRFASGNYEAIVQVTAPFGLSALAGLMLAGVILWEALSAALFWYTGVTFQGIKLEGPPGPLVLTFTVSLALWAGFQIACEALPSPLAFQIGGTHRSVFTAQLATLLALVLLPDDRSVPREE